MGKEIKPGDIMRTTDRYAPHIGVTDDLLTVTVDPRTNVIVIDCIDTVAMTGFLMIRVKLPDGNELLMNSPSLEHLDVNDDV